MIFLAKFSRWAVIVICSRYKQPVHMLYQVRVNRAVQRR